MFSQYASRIRAGLLLVSVVCLFPGCGGAPDQPDFVSDLVPVSGTIKLNGEPLAGVMVNYFPQGPQGGGQPAYGLTNESGQYTLQTQMAGQAEKQTSGALPGQYLVYISKLILPDGSGVPEGLSDAEAEEKGAKQLLPAKYSSPTQSSLKATVNQGETTVDFELKK